LNFSDGCVVDTRRKFQAAWAASYLPARNPMRGSGLGAATDIMLPIGVGPMFDAVLAVGRAHAPAAQIANRNDPAFRR
jgi:hypothetical protein